MSSSLFNDSGVSIPISDDDSDELGRMRVRVRRKRKKSLHRVNNELTRRVVRFFMKYWMVLVLVFAIGLLVFEATRIGRKPSMIVKTEQGKVTSQLKEFKRPIPDKKSNSTLNRLDPVMKIVHGVKEPCLKMLRPDELENLDLPMNKESSSPIKKVVYLSGNDLPYVGGNSTLSQQPREGTRFNLFTGIQTFDQREESFKVKETAEIHCGFYSE
ncbi:hypothetical protein CISIN_1g042685mg, partial [Citrus sinensis]